MVNYFNLIIQLYFLVGLLLAPGDTILKYFLFFVYYYLGCYNTVQIDGVNVFVRDKDLWIWVSGLVSTKWHWWRAFTFSLVFLRTNKGKAYSKYIPRISALLTYSRRFPANPPASPLSAWGQASSRKALDSYVMDAAVKGYICLPRRTLCSQVGGFQWFIQVSWGAFPLRLFLPYFTNRPLLTLHYGCWKDSPSPIRALSTFQPPSPSKWPLCPPGWSPGLGWWVLFHRNVSWSFSLRVLRHKVPVVNSKLITALKRECLSRHDFMSLS